MQTAMKATVKTKNVTVCLDMLTKKIVQSMDVSTYKSFGTVVRKLIFGARK